MIQACNEMGVKLSGDVIGDCAPLQGLLERRGTGRVKHLELRQLWMQEKYGGQAMWLHTRPHRFCGRRLSVCLSVCLSVWQSVCQFVCLSVCPVL